MCEAVGCTPNYSAEIKKALSEKYGESFEVDKITNGVIMGGGMRYFVLCHPTKDDKLKFSLYYYTKGSNIDDMYENYLLAHDIEKELSETISKLADDFTVTVNVNEGGSGYRESKSAKDYCSRQSVECTTVIAVNMSKKCRVEPDDLYPVLQSLFSNYSKLKGKLYFALVEQDTMDKIAKFTGETPRIDSTLLGYCDEGVCMSVTVSDGAVQLERESLINALY